MQRVINKTRVKDKYLDLLSYLISNKELIKNGSGPFMGTQEGTNAHVFAARMKAWGGAWSRRGAAFMAAVRARIAPSEKLIAPACDNVMYDDYQIAIRAKHEWQRREYSCYISESAGKDYEPPQGRLALSTRMAPHLYGVFNYS